MRRAQDTAAASAAVGCRACRPADSGGALLSITAHRRSENRFITWYCRDCAAVTNWKPSTTQDSAGGESRTWLLPLLRQNVGNTSLAFWGESLLPLARSLIERAAVIPTGGEEGLSGLQYRALEAQIWNTLPSFCSWPLDAAEAFQYEPFVEASTPPPPRGFGFVIANQYGHGMVCLIGTKFRTSSSLTQESCASKRTQSAGSVSCMHFVCPVPKLINRHLSDLQLGCDSTRQLGSQWNAMMRNWNIPAEAGSTSDCSSQMAVNHN